jgi:PKD domain
VTPRPEKNSDGLRPAFIRSILALILVLALAFCVAVGNSAPVAAQIPGGTNLTLSPSTTSPSVGQTVTFNYSASPPAVAPPFASISKLTLDFGDGATTDLTSSTPAGQTVTGSTTHAYASAGAYTAVLSASASNGGSGRATASMTVTGNGQIPGSPVVVNLQTGWNLIAVPPGATLQPGPIPMPYTWHAGDTQYTGVQNNQSGVGYWQFLDHAAMLSIPSGSPATVTIQLPPGQWIMVGNPGSRTATVKGADVVYVYSQGSGYQQTTTLQPGQGAWVFSNSGGPLTISG